MIERKTIEIGGVLCCVMMLVVWSFFSGCSRSEDPFDAISNYSGEATVRDVFSGLGHDHDTTYTEYITFSKSQGRLLIDSEFDSFTTTYDLSEKEVFEGGISLRIGPGSSYDYLVFYNSKDSLYLETRAGGFSAGRLKWCSITL